jgi:peroxiredoxin
MRPERLDRLVLLAAAALICVLAWQNRALRREVRVLAARSSEPYLGMYLPTVPATSLDGASLVLGAPAGDFQILYFFTPSCGHCEASAATVAALASRLASSGRPRAQVIGLGHGDDGELRTYAAAHGFAFPVAAVSDRRTLALFRAGAVPLVVVVAADGRVHHAHVGRFDSERAIDDVLAAMARSLASHPHPTGARS